MKRVKLGEVKRFYGVQYWYLDEHDFLIQDGIVAQTKAELIAKSLNESGKYKDAIVFPYLAKYVNEPFEYNGVLYDDYKWITIDGTRG